MRKATSQTVGELLGAVTAMTCLAGCPWVIQPGGTEQGQALLQKFASGDEMLRFFRQQVLARHRPVSILERLGGGWGLGPAAEPEAGDAGTGDQGDESTAYTTTNIQEEGVDESDLFKSDGQYFYIAKGRTLRLVKAVPPNQMEEVGQVEFDEPVDSLYLYNGQAIVIGQGRSWRGSWTEGVAVAVWPPYYEDNRVVVSAVDLTDPTSPTVVAQRELEGSLVSSRLVNGRLILILTIVPAVPDSPNILNMSMVSLDQILPKTRHGGSEEIMVPPENWYRPASPNGYYATAVVTLDAAEVETVVGSLAVMANVGTIYASTEALYLTDTDYTLDNEYRQTTTIHKLAFNEDGVAEYAASGSVPGRLLNQFCLSEHEGYLRVATQVDNFELLWAAERVTAAAPVDNAGGPSAQVLQQTGPYNAVYVLGQSEATLEIVGAIEGIAPGEDLHAARFLGDHAFLVTYRKIDPLFVLDLSDPTAPQLLGELVIPGFSDYLHPLDQTHLIGVGKATIAEEDFDWYQGVQVSLFDVSDWANPVAIQQITFGGRGSECDVLQTHKAFTFLAENNLLALPVELTTMNDIPWEYGLPDFSGVIVLQVDPATGFTELGQLEAVGDQGESWYWWSFGWQRAAIIGNVVYSVTSDGVRAAALDEFDAPHTLELAPGEEEEPSGGGGEPGEGGPVMPL